MHQQPIYENIKEMKQTNKQTGKLNYKKTNQKPHETKKLGNPCGKVNDLLRVLP